MLGKKHYDSASHLRFASSRTKKRLEQGTLTGITPSTQSGEDAKSYARRMNQPQYAQILQRERRKKRVLIGLVCVLIVLGVGLGVGVAVYFGTSTSKLSLGASNAQSALVSPEDGEAYYVVLAAQLGNASSDISGAPEASSEAYELIRVDEDSHTLTFISIPSNLRCNLSDGDTHPLYDACEIGGDAALIEAISSFAGVDIAHFVRSDAAGIVGLVDIVGNVGVISEQEIDDPSAGDVYIAAGDVALDSQNVLTFLRASNFSDSVTVQAENRNAFLCSFLNQCLEFEGLSFASSLDAAAEYIQTDLSPAEIIGLAEAFRPFSQVTVYEGVVPGSSTTLNDVEVFAASSSDWEALMSQVEAGLNPANVGSVDTSQVNPASVSVEVRNGAGITGAAAELSQTIASAGYNVERVGNVDDATTYPETLVIYHDSAFEAAAYAVVEAADAGRVVNGGDYYSFETNILVIVGADWMPAE